MVRDKRQLLLPTLLQLDVASPTACCPAGLEQVFTPFNFLTRMELYESF